MYYFGLVLLFSWCFSAYSAESSKSTVSTTLSFGDGVNLQPSYYNNGNVSFGWSLMKQYAKIKTVRIEVEPDKVSQAVEWISQAHSHGYHIIVTYHKYSVLGSNDVKELNEAANWWVSHYHSLTSGGSVPITVNMMNEWGNHEMTPSTYASAYNNAIATLRKVYSGSVIIDCPGWGQESATAAAAVKSYGLKTDGLSLSMHVYPDGWNSGKQHAVCNADVDDLASAGVPCIIGEFGSSGATGPVDVSSVVQHAKSKGWSVLGWAWNGDGGAVMNMVSPSWAKDASATSFSKSSYFHTVYDLL